MKVRRKNEEEFNVRVTSHVVSLVFPLLLFCACSVLTYILFECWKPQQGTVLIGDHYICQSSYCFETSVGLAVEKLIPIWSSFHSSKF